MAVDGHYIPHGTSRPEAATLALHGDNWVVTGAGATHMHPALDSVVSERLGSVPRRVEFPDGGQFTTADNDGIDDLLLDGGWIERPGVVDRLERRWRWALLAVIAVPLSLWLLFTLGMPIIARPIAAVIPEEAVDYLDDSALELLEDNLFQPSELSAERQAEIEALLQHLPEPGNVDLLFRTGGVLGANALALPGGTVVMTDELVELAEYDGELLAVLAHEAGHVEGRHALRNVVQSAGVVVVLGWILGDLTFVTDIVLVSTPALLQQLTYTRDFEREADAYALGVLASAGYPPDCFSGMMRKLQAQLGGLDELIPNYLQSHPDMDERIAAGDTEASCER